MNLEPQFSFDPASQGQRVDFAAGKPRILTIAFTLFWFAGWLFLVVLLALDYLRFRSPNIAGVVLLVLAGAPAALALLWAATGKRESLIVTPSELRIYRWAGPIRLSRSISIATVVGTAAGRGTIRISLRLLCRAGVLRRRLWFRGNRRRTSHA